VAFSTASKGLVHTGFEVRFNVVGLCSYYIAYSAAVVVVVVAVGIDSNRTNFRLATDKEVSWIAVATKVSIAFDTFDFLVSFVAEIAAVNTRSTLADHKTTEHSTTATITQPPNSIKTQIPAHTATSLKETAENSSAAADCRKHFTKGC